MLRAYLKDNIFLLSLFFSFLLHAAILVPGIFDRTNSFIKADGEEGRIFVYLHERQKGAGEKLHDNSVQDGPIIADTEKTADKQARQEHFHVERGGGTRAHEYLAMLRERIIRSKQYPRRAQWLKISGRNRISFFVKPDGNVDNIRILDGSGYPILDTESCDAIRRACPFPPMPSDIQQETLEVALTLYYKL